MKVGERSRIVNEFFRAKKWSKVQEVLLDWLKEDPSDHWALTRLSSTYAEEGNYAKALDYIEHALRIEPRCPLALADCTEALYMLGRHEEAIQICKSLIRRGPKRISHGKCGQGLPWARSLINDLRYELGLLYGSQDEFDLAKKYIKAHIANRSRICRSVYKLHEVKKDLKLIQEGQYPY